MNIQELLVGIYNCGCGRDHICPMDNVYIEDNACKRLTELCEKHEYILVVADKNTYACGGEKVRAQIKEKIENTVIFDEQGVLVPNERAIETISSRITPKTDLIIGIGSGVINDLCKHVSFNVGLRYFIVATAPSMDGYASVGAALILNGMKVTVNAEVPQAIIGDTQILKNAPIEMIRSGYGDIIGKYSCLNDWRLSNLVNDEYICDTVLNATYEEVKKTVLLADGIVKRDEAAIKALMESLVAVGILMAYVGNSRPASGSEHHFSHYFEIIGILRGEEYLPHGTDVCYSAIETAKIREKLMSIEDISDREYHFNRDAYETQIKRIYGALADEVFALQYKNGWYDIDRIAVYKNKWKEICKLLAECPNSSEMQTLVEKIGLSYNNFLEFYGKDKINDAWLYAKDLKDRYSVLWLYYDLFSTSLG